VWVLSLCGAWWCLYEFTAAKSSSWWLSWQYHSRTTASNRPSTLSPPALYPASPPLPPRISPLHPPPHPHPCRNRRCPKGRHFAFSFLALGAVASGYHGADRSSWLRPVMRKLDYYTICYTSTVLRRAAHIPLPSAVSVASLLIAPVKPSVVTGLNLLLVEVRAESGKGGWLCKPCWLGLPFPPCCLDRRGV